MLTINSYFDDQVKSIGFQGESLPSTVGVISAGEYQFDTSQNEVVSVVSGVLSVQLPNTSDWVDYSSGESFEIAANQSFSVRANKETAYLCTYA